MWLIHGERYDLTPLFRTHPGGEHILLLTEGTDVTALFETSHAFSDAPRDLLSRYGPAYAGKGVDPMHEELRRSVRGVFGPQRSAAKTPPLTLAALLGAQASVMAVMIYSRSDLAAVAFGLVFATCGGRTIHAASHYNAARSPRANEMIGECMGVVLGFPYGAWLIGHVLSHHPHTNGPMDVDTHLMRGPRWYAAMIAPLPLFTATGVVHGAASAWQSAFVGAGGAYRARAVARSVVATLAFHAAMCVLVDGWIRMWLIGAYVGGAWFMFFAQLSHVGAGDAPGRSWSEAQVNATENYEGDSRVWHFLSIGLTNQIEHHLLPMVSDSHAWRIKDAVRAACARHGVPYRSPSIRTATARIARAVFSILSRPR
jgi:fatty acid desaturase